MKSTDVTSKTENDLLLDLGAWLGRHQAFGLIANRCSAADAECLREIRDSGAYRQLASNWETFCMQYAGVSRPTADKIIRNLERFGASYFHLNRLVRLSPAKYEAVAGSLRDTYIEYDGRRIPLDRQHAHEIAEVVEQLHRDREAAAAQLEEVRAGIGEAAAQLASSPAERKLAEALTRLDAVLARLLALNHKLDEAGRTAVRQSLDRISATLDQLSAA